MAKEAKPKGGTGSTANANGVYVAHHPGGTRGSNSGAK